jgi:hypothetical protein
MKTRLVSTHVKSGNDNSQNVLGSLFPHFSRPTKEVDKRRPQTYITLYRKYYVTVFRNIPGISTRTYVCMYTEKKANFMIPRLNLVKMSTWIGKISFLNHNLTLFRILNGELILSL